MTRTGEAGFRQAVRERDEPFGDHGASTFNVDFNLRARRLRTGSSRLLKK